MNIKPFILLFVFTFLMGNDPSYQNGVSAYNSRALNASGMLANPDQINLAINAFKKAQQNPNYELDAGVYLLQCYYYKGKFVAQEDDSKKVIFSLGKDLGELLIEKYPKSAPVRYWYLVNLGSWSEIYGLFAAAKEGVADLMRKHSEIIIDLDPNYSNGGGYFMLGAVHLKSPYIPFLLSWPDKNKAVDYLSRAAYTGEATLVQKRYLAHALYKTGDKKDALELLKEIIRSKPSKDEYVEDLEDIREAKLLLKSFN